MKLSAKQKKFCEEYLIDLNSTQAAIRAGYSENTARSIGSENLTKPDIQAYLNSIRSELQNETKITTERVLAEYAKIAFFDIREVYDVDGGLTNIKQLDDNSAGALSSVKSMEEWGEDDEGNKIIIGTTKEVKVFDKIRALDALGKHLGLFEKDNQQKLPIQIDASKLSNDVIQSLLNASTATQ